MNQKKITESTESKLFASKSVFCILASNLFVAGGDALYFYDQIYKGHTLRLFLNLESISI